MSIFFRMFFTWLWVVPEKFNEGGNYIIPSAIILTVSSCSFVGFKIISNEFDGLKRLYIFSTNNGFFLNKVKLSTMNVACDLSFCVGVCP